MVLKLRLLSERPNIVTVREFPLSVTFGKYRTNTSNVKMLYLITIILLATLAIYYHDRQRDKGIPPGPPRMPLVGNYVQLPQENPWRTYAQWSKQYGPIFS